MSENESENIGVYDYNLISPYDIQLEDTEIKGVHNIMYDGDQLNLVGAPIMLTKAIKDDSELYLTFKNIDESFVEFVKELEVAVCDKLREKGENLKTVRKNMKSILHNGSFKQRATVVPEDGLLSILFFDSSSNLIKEVNVENFTEFFKEGTKFIPIYIFDRVKRRKDRITIKFSIMQLMVHEPIKESKKPQKPQKPQKSQKPQKPQKPQKNKLVKLNKKSKKEKEKEKEKEKPVVSDSSSSSGSESDYSGSESDSGTGSEYDSDSE